MLQFENVTDVLLSLKQANKIVNNEGTVVSYFDVKPALPYEDEFYKDDNTFVRVYLDAENNELYRYENVRGRLLKTKGTPINWTKYLKDGNPFFTSIKPFSNN